MDYKTIHDQLKKILKEKKVTVVDSLQLNWKSNVVLIVAVFILTDNFLKGLATLKFSYVLWYVIHILAHMLEVYSPIPSFGVFHHYHHTHDDWLGLIVEVVVAELGFIAWFSLLYWVLFDPKMDYLDPWILTFYAFMYVTIHNVNYSFLKVNETHRMHHLNPFKNIGPDICDIIFDSKADDEPENTDHYIGNTCLITLFLLFIKTSFDSLLLMWIYVSFCMFSIIVGFVFYLYILCNLNLNNHQPQTVMNGTTKNIWT